MRALAVLLVHVLAILARLARPGRVRATVAESVLVKQQLLILNRTRKRSPRLRLGDGAVAGVCALLMRPCRLVDAAIFLKPSTLRLHRELTTRKYCAHGRIADRVPEDQSPANSPPLRSNPAKALLGLGRRVAGTFAAR